MSPSTQNSQHSIVAWSFYHKYSNILKQYQSFWRLTAILGFLKV